MKQEIGVIKDLPLRNWWSLKKAGIDTIDDLKEYGIDNLINIKNIGPKAVEIIKKYFEIKNPLKEEFYKINICGCTRICFGHKPTQDKLWKWINKNFKPRK